MRFRRRDRPRDRGRSALRGWDTGDATPPLEPEPTPEYSGPALLDAPGLELPVTVALSGHLDPTDGHFHWYGRISAPETADLPDPGRGQIFLTLPGRTPVAGRLQERDPWGNLRVTGIGAPPFPLAEDDIPA